MMVMKTGVGALTDDEARFVEIYGRFAWPIQAYCARRTPGSQVADAVSDIFLIAWRRIDQIPAGDEALPGSTALPSGCSLISGGTTSVAGSSLNGSVALPRSRTAPEVLLVRSEEHRVVLAASASEAGRPGDTPTHPLGRASTRRRGRCPRHRAQRRQATPTGPV